MTHLLRIRSNIESTTKRDNLQRRVDYLDDFVKHSDPNTVFDHAYSTIDTVCKTILNDYNQTIENHQDLPKTFKQTLNLFWRDDTSEDDSVKKIVRWLIQTVQWICELRNSQWAISHWKDITTEQAKEITLLTTVKAIDVIVWFLMFMDKSSVKQDRHIRYEDYETFNQRYDEQYWSIKIWSYEWYSPSELLYKVDMTAYKEELEQYDLENKP